jgi:Cu+-exporting ATPase
MGRRALIRFEPSLTSPLALAAAVRSLGFTADVLPSDISPLASGPLSASALSREALSWRRQFLGSLIFTLPVFVIAMVLPHTPAGPSIERDVAPGLTLRVALLWVLVTPVQFGFGMQFYRRAWRALSHGTSNMDVLVRA